MSTCELQEKYDKLLEKYIKLQKDYSENIIIESMNDMKIMYDNQKKKIDKLLNIVDNILDKNKSVNIMLSVLTKNLNNNTSKHELKCKLEFIQEIVDTSIRHKNEIYYFAINIVMCYK